MISLGQMADLFNVTPVSLEDRDFLPRRFVVDSRQVGKGDVFVAFKGQHCNGVDFVDQAIAQGACAIIVPAESADVVGLRGVPVFAVEDCLQALQKLASFVRNLFQGTVIAVTGSCGKTTTKDMLAHILSQRYAVVAAKNSFNNLLGVSLTLLELTPDTEVLVLELGTNHPGEIAQLSELSRPDYAIVTAIQKAHLEGLGSLAAIQVEKLSIATGLAAEGLLIVPQEDLVSPIETMQGQSIFFVGENIGVEGNYQLVRVDSEGQWFNALGVLEAFLPLFGAHQVRNAVMAAVCARALGVSAQDSFRALETFSPREGRFYIRRGSAFTIVDDTYNANIGSFAASFRALKLFAQGKTIAAIIGDMGELGCFSDALHQELGGMVAQLSPKVCYYVGEKAAIVKESLLEHAYSGLFYSFPNVTELLGSDWTEVSLKQDVLFFKASRFIGLERAIQSLHLNENC